MSRNGNAWPRISIVTCSLNQGQFLERTVLSVVTQDYPDIEYIVIDGGSTDGTVEVIRKYEPQLAYWVSEKDRGQYDAYLKGFRRATGTILGWLDSDDVLLPGALKKVGGYFLRHPDCEVISGGAYAIDEMDDPLQGLRPAFSLGVSASYRRFQFYEMDGVKQQATFMKRAAYESVGGIDITFDFIADRDLLARLAKRRPVERLPHFLACYRVHKSSKSSRLQAERRRESEIFAERHGRWRYGRAVAFVAYSCYRLASLTRKSVLWVLLKSGLITLNSLRWDGLNTGAVPRNSE
jgi:glycosyltransferase involved in cell wall biosynthesis